MFTHQELLAIIRLCDVGTRAGGLEIAEIALPIAMKIKQSMRPVETMPHLVRQDANRQENG